MLLAILAGVIGLVVIAFAILLTRPGPAYLPDGTPEAAVHNYLLALQLSDDSRAYTYLSPTVAGYPQTADGFRHALQQNSWAFEGLKTATFSVGDAVITDSSASVSVDRRSVDSGSLFGGPADARTIRFQLERSVKSGAWQIVKADELWPYCWDYDQGC
jgi:hypothetical protein